MKIRGVKLSFLFPVFALLAFGLSAKPSFAGHYEMIEQIGGTISFPSPSGGGAIETHPYSTNSDGGYGSSGFVSNLSGQIETKFQWIRQTLANGSPDSSDNPPSKVIVREYCYAMGSWNGWGSAAANNGLESPENEWQYPMGPFLYWGQHKSRGIRESVKAGTEIVTVNCSPSASGGTWAGVSYFVAVAPDYVSGTNASLPLSLPVGFEGILQSFQFQIGGDTVHSGGNASELYSKQVINFDSTHFSDDLNLYLYSNAVNTQGKIFKDRLARVVYNKGVILVGQTPISGTPTHPAPPPFPSTSIGLISSFMTSMNHSVETAMIPEDASDMSNVIDVISGQSVNLLGRIPRGLPRL